jgi:polysaccharide pyruvyl transferase WcaK-like protein
MKILLFTATGAENLGDELITLCEIQHLQKVYPDAHITLFSHDILRTRRFLLSQNISQEHITLREYFPNASKKQCHHIYVGGGGLLYGKSEEGHSPLRLWWMRARIAKFFKKPLTYLSLGISAGVDELKPVARTLFA